mmetsp:Transcript_23999/g.31006  ORF Transcript_23999/g.31006 Transcript_23999/m.31006 type:complete len:494 (-) Transcript_23999:279-1760(-)
MHPLVKWSRNIFSQKKKLKIIQSPFWKIEKALNKDSWAEIIRSFPYFPIYLCLGYLICCYLGTWIMRSRKPWGMKWVSAVWNVLFAIFSLCGTIRVAPLTLQVFLHSGVEGLVYHDPDLTYRHKTLELWTLLFIVSKVLELWDTFFLIIRKEELSFIHRYHHITVLVYSWNAYTRDSGVSVFFIMMNYSVHTLMYFYYFLQSFLDEISWLPGWLLTASQICQMFLGMSLCFTSAILQYDNWLHLLRILDLINVLRQFDLLHPSKLSIVIEWLHRLRILPPLEIAKIAVQVYLVVSYIVLWMMLWQKGCFLVESCFMGVDENGLPEDVKQMETKASIQNLKVLTYSGNNTLKGKRVVFAWTPSRGSKQWSRSMRRLNIPDGSIRRVYSAPLLRSSLLCRGLSSASLQSKLSFLQRPRTQTLAPRSISLLSTEDDDGDLPLTIDEDDYIPKASAKERSMDEFSRIQQAESPHKVVGEKPVLTLLSSGLGRQSNLD